LDDVVVRLSLVADRLRGSLRELEINPVVVGTDGVMAVDVLAFR
jgi:hypothetical protein